MTKELEFPTFAERSKRLEDDYHIEFNELDDVRNLSAGVRIGALLSIYQEYARWQWLFNKFYLGSVSLGQFIECDSDGKPMVKPYEGLFEITGKKYAGCTLLEYDPEHHNAPEDCRYYDLGKFKQAVKEFEAAEKRVLFKGWRCSYKSDDEVRVVNDLNHTGFVFRGGKMSVINPPNCIDAFINRYSWLIPTDSATSFLSLKQPENTDVNP